MTRLNFGAAADSARALVLSQRHLRKTSTTPASSSAKWRCRLLPHYVPQPSKEERVLSRILIVDDDRAMIDQLAGWLSGAGHDCVTACEPHEALDLADARPPAAAIVNVHLPGKDGMWVARHLRRRSDDIGVILLTSTPSFTGGVIAMRMGVNDYLLKPCTQQDVLDAVDRALAWRSAVQRDRSSRDLMREATVLARGRVVGGSRRDPASALDALMAVLNSRLPNTFEHSRRVARMSVRLADTLRVSASARTDIERAALLHDIGKIAILDAVLDKRGPLTDDEADHLESHVKIGFAILSALPALHQLGRLVIATSERYDGNGYPSGLAGAEIPLGARVIAVADAYDVITVGEHLRSPLSADDANAELVRRAGTSFDPDVVRAWLRVEEGPLCS